MSEAKRLYHQKRAARKLDLLASMLAGGDDRAWLGLLWAVNVLLSDFAAAATAAAHFRFAIHKWELETLGTLLLSTGKASDPRAMAMDNFATMAGAVNLLRDVENHEVGANLDPADIMLEMARIAHRQFGWQRGFGTSERLYRYVYIYGQGACAQFFEETYGLPVSEFMSVGFYLYAQLHNQPWALPVAVEKLGVDIDLIGRVLPVISHNLPDARAQTLNLIAQLQGGGAAGAAYLPSILRRFPIVRDDPTGAYIAPLPQLIIHRITVGLAQFAQDPVATARNAFTQLVKGVAQLWRFFSHVRRGIYAGPPVADDAQGVLLTLDTWMQVDAVTRDKVLERARQLVAAEINVTDADKRSIVFCSMQDLADVMIVSSEDQFLAALKSATQDKFHGWDLREVRRRAGDEKAREYPFDVHEVLPWWAQLRDAREGRKLA